MGRRHRYSERGVAPAPKLEGEETWLQCETCLRWLREHEPEMMSAIGDLESAARRGTHDVAQMVPRVT